MSLICKRRSKVTTSESSRWPESSPSKSWWEDQIPNSKAFDSTGFSINPKRNRVGLEPVEGSGGVIRNYALQEWVVCFVW